MKAIIFDFDGVIADSEYHWDRHSLNVYRSFVPGFTKDDDMKLKGRSTADIYDMLVRNYGFSMTKEEYLEIIGEFAHKVYLEWTLPLPGVVELIRRLVQRGIPLGIASSSRHKWIDTALERFDLTHIFNPIVTAEDVGVGKPNPAVYAEAARLIGFDPGDCIAIEDSTNGLRSAKGAGMKCIGLHHTEGYIQDLKEADLVIEHFDELTDDVLNGL
jgi:HAD superfamily hydrolase (TIGR01509 family)